MHLTILLSVLIAAATGLATKVILDWRNSEQHRISWMEYLIVLAVIAMVVAPGSVYVGWEIAKKERTVFHEFWNGWELTIQKEDVACYRDGPCRWEYNCDPYLVSYPCNCDSKGNCDTCWRTEYHDCPYVTVETHYYVQTTLGRYVIDRYRFPENPQSHRWRKSTLIPGYVIERAGVGEPSFWKEARKRIESGYPGPVTQRHEYNNYIYASDQSILKQYHDAVKKYEALGLFPIFQKTIHDFYYANKVYFVGFSPENSRVWQSSVSYLNAAAGSSLQGDLHLVAVNDSKISDFEEYALALKAYWQDKSRHGRDAMSKNSIVVVCATDGRNITKARSFTGMPVGNEYMLVAIDGRLKGMEFNPAKIIGQTRGKLSGGMVINEISKGVLEDIIFGFSDPATKFKRISMVKKDADDVGGGFLYLASEIQPTDSQKTWIFIATFIFCGMAWLAVVFVDDRKFFKRGERR